MGMDRRAFIKRTLLAGVGVALTPLAKALPPSNIAHISSIGIWEEMNALTLRHVAPLMRANLLVTNRAFYTYIKSRTLPPLPSFPFKESL